MPPRVVPSPASRQRRSSRSSDPRRLSGGVVRRSSADWLLAFDPRTALDPHSPFLKAWYQILLLALVFQCFLLPYAVVFVSPEVKTTTSLPSLFHRPEFKVFYGVEAFFVVDFYVKLNTGFYEDGNIYRDASRARVKYLFSLGFVLDAIAIVPLALVVQSQAIGVSPVWLECHKFLRLWRVPQYFAILEDLYAKFFVTLKVLKVVVVTTFVTHVLACARVSFGYRTATENNDQLWLPSPDHSSSLYLRSFFWTFGLLTGVYEGELPRESAEFVFSIIVLLTGFSLFSYLCAVFFVLSKSEQTRGTAAEAKLNQLKHMLCYYHVPEQLQTQAVEYIKRYHTDAEANDREIVQLLCPSIVRDVQVELLRDTIAAIPLFKECSNQFITALTCLLEMVSLPADFEVFASGDPGDSMYVVVMGLLHILVNGTKVRELRSGSFFGEVSVFSKRPRSATVVTTSYCTLYKLSRFHIERVLEGFPQYAELIAQEVDTILSAHTSTTGGSAVPTNGNDFVLTTLFHDSYNSGVPTIPITKSKTPPGSPTAHRLKRRRSLNTGNDEPVAPKIKKAPVTKRPQIGRSKSAMNVSVERREQMSLMSRRSEREKTEQGNTDAPDQKNSGQFNEPKEESLEQSPTFVPRPNVLKRSHSFFSKRSNDDTATLNLFSHRSAMAVDAMQNFYDNLSKMLSQKRQHPSKEAEWWSKFLLRKPIPRLSRFRYRWLVGLQCVLLYFWITVPALLGFQILRTHLTTTWGFHFVNTIMVLMLWVDIFVMANLELPPSAHADNEKELTTTQLAMRYMWSKACVADVLCALPYPLIGYSAGSTVWGVLLSIPRLGRIWRLPEHFREWRNCRLETSSSALPPSQPSDSSWNQAQQLIALCVAVCLLLHVVACAFFGLTRLEGFSDSASDSSWLPTADLSNETAQISVGALFLRQYSRALFFSATTLTTLGETIEPASDTQITFAIVCMVLGLVVSALLVDIVHTRFTSATVEQREFLVTRARIQSFLRSQSAPADIMQRVNAFLDFWWSSHRGAIASDLLYELPDSIKRDILQAMCLPAVQTLALLADVRPVLTALEKVFVDSVDFILYGQGETIYRQGDYASGLFFLLDGEVCMITDGNVPQSIPKGGFFGTASLHLNESSVSYTERMTAISGCILLFLSREDLQAMHNTFPTLSMALKALEKRIIDSKLVRAHALESRRASALSSTSGRRVLGSSRWFPRLRDLVAKVFQVNNEEVGVLFDPDSSTSEVWQIWIALLIVFQSFKMVYEICFGVSVHRVWVSEAVTVLCELCFAMDMYFHSRLGFYEYGNKIMDLVHIQRRYYGSKAFIADAIAIVPLYVLNWFIALVGGYKKRVELLGINKLARLIRVNMTLSAIEAQYLNRTLELRLLKIVYYTMLLAHTLGCIWFSFGNTSTPKSSWVPDANLRNATSSVQYLSAIYWSFGVMSASTTSAVPQTPLESLFAVVTMLGGLGLFAYIVGNLADVVELRGADTREFNSQFATIRHLLSHFALPEGLQDKLKTYAFFQRSHSITQEHVLESYLPPSLLTDIRLVHLQPMIIKVAFLAGMEPSVTRMLVSQFQQVLVVKDQYVCRYGDLGSDMFFVFTGVIDVLVPASTLHRLSSETATMGGAIGSASAKPLGVDDEKKPRTAVQSLSSPQLKPTSTLSGTTMKKVNELNPGSYFGEIALFSNKPRTASTLARTSCVLYKLSRRSLELVFERYPGWKKRVLKIVSIQQEQQHLRNLYMAEQQHDEELLKQMKEQSDSTSSPISPRRLRDKLVQSSKRIVRRMSNKGADAAQSTPSKGLENQSGGVGTTRVSPETAIPITSDSSVPFKQPPTSSTTTSERMTPPSSSVKSASKSKSSKTKPASKLWIDKLLDCTDVQSPTHVMWLRIVAIATVFMAIAMPFLVAFDLRCYQDNRGKMIHILLPMIARALTHVCELIFAWDIWMNWNMKESLSSMELYETRHREAYQKQRQLLWDALAAFPFDHFIVDFYESPWLRLNRCLKVINFQHYVDEIYRRSVRYEQTRFVARWLLFLIGMYWCSCAYFVAAKFTTTEPTNAWYQWSPPAVYLNDAEEIANHRDTMGVTPVEQLAMRMERSFFFAVTVFVKKGKTFVPHSGSQLLFTLVISFVGLLAMALMIGEVAHLYVSYISNEVEFRHHHIALRTYLERWRISGRLRVRAHDFLSSLWSSHRGVDYHAVLEDIPPEIRNDVVLHVGNASLEAFVTQTFSPLLPKALASRTELESTMRAIAEQLKYQGYPRDENVIVEGSIAKDMFFVVKGLLISRTSAESVITAALASPPQSPDDSISMIPREVRLSSGDFFGERGLLGYAMSRCVVRTVRACDLLSLSSEALLGVLQSRPLFQTALSIAVETYREMAQLMREKCSYMDVDADMDAAVFLGLSTPEEPWGEILLAVIEKRQHNWQEQWKAGEMTSTLHTLLGPMRDVKHPDLCRQMFDNLLRLILPHGSLYARVASGRNKSRDHHSTFDTMGGHMPSTADFHENLPVMQGATGMHNDLVGWSFQSTVSTNSSRDLSFHRRVSSRSRLIMGPSRTAKMLPPEH